MCEHIASRTCPPLPLSFLAHHHLFFAHPWRETEASPPVAARDSSAAARNRSRHLRCASSPFGGPSLCPSPSRATHSEEFDEGGCDAKHTPCCGRNKGGGHGNWVMGGGKTGTRRRMIIIECGCMVQPLRPSNHHHHSHHSRFVQMT